VGCDLRLAAPSGTTPLRYRDAVFTTVTTTSNIVYGSAVDQTGVTVSLTLDAYRPAGDTITKRPAIVWVHGGSFSSGDKTSGELVDEATTFAKKGYVNVSINYRLSTGCSASGATAACVTSIVDAKHDAQAAVRFLRANATTYGVDPDRIAIGGTSAGAAVIAVPSAGDAPSLLFHGTADPLVPYQWAVNTQTNAQAAGLTSELTTWDGAGHVPYVEHRTEILDQTTNFLYWTMDLTHAAR